MNGCFHLDKDIQFFFTLYNLFSLKEQGIGYYIIVTPLLPCSFLKICHSNDNNKMQAAG